MRRQMYLKRDPNTGIYKYRREYPKNVKKVLGKTNFIRFLHTTNINIANKACSEAEKRLMI